jgi:LppP/LprE lipoprotein
MESAFVRSSKSRSVRWAVGLGLVTMLSVWPAAPAGAQDGAPPPEPGFTVGDQIVDSSTWNFNGDLSVNVGPWGQVTVTNTNCAVPYRPGTAQAGAIIFTATLQTEQTPGGLQLAQGDLLPFIGSGATGHVSVLTPAGAAPTSHVDATLVGLDDFALNNDFSVCLSPADMTGVTADVVMDANFVLSQSYQPFQTVVTPTTPTSPSLVAIAGTKFPTADGYDQWVFFFLGTTFLGTDTAVSSPQLDLTGSPGPGQVDVTYVDYTDGAPLCCPDLPPVTITYTWDGAQLVASGTPPGH